LPHESKGLSSTWPDSGNQLILDRYGKSGLRDKGLEAA